MCPWIDLSFQNGILTMTAGGPQGSQVPGAIVPDGGWGWMVVFASLMIHFIMDGFVVPVVVRSKLMRIDLESPIPWVMSFYGR